MLTGSGRVALGTLVEYLAVLAFPAMMIFGMRGMRGGTQAGQQAPAQTPEERRLALQLEMRELDKAMDKARLARGEMTLEEFVRLHGSQAPTPEAAEDARPAPLRAAPARPRARAG